MFLIKYNCVTKHIKSKAAFPLWATATNIGNPSLILRTPKRIWTPKKNIKNTDKIFWNEDLIDK